MFLGRFNHNIDDKGRLTIPARFRDQLVVEGAYLMLGLDRNLMVLPPEAFEALSQRVNSLNLTDPNARMLRRLFYSTADRVEVDRVGRILLPQFLRESIGLQSAAVIVGNGDHFEIWAPENWQAQDEQLQDSDANASRFAGLELTPNNEQAS
jgi:MraZ protein